MAPEKTGSCVDVLIIGAGPAGCMTALWLSRLGVNARIIDKRSEGVQNGHADGLNSRSLEIFESFGLESQIFATAVPQYEKSEWELSHRGISRTNTIMEEPQDSSRYVEHLLNQGLIESTVLGGISPQANVHVERNAMPVALSVSDEPHLGPDSHPVSVKVAHLSRRISKDEGARDKLSNGNGQQEDEIENCMMETIHAKYVVGCDGAHSWTRKQLGISTRGDRTNYLWGVIDIRPITNFPDIRKCNVVQTKGGCMLIIPREAGLVRCYVPLGDTADGLNKASVTPSQIFNLVKEALYPYTIGYSYCDWWTCYEIGQRVADRFSDDTWRIFLAGDAVHTHSPKAGQGMNTSMQDAYNLGWKIAGVLKGIYGPDMLRTYELERREVARKLIAIDRALAGAYQDQRLQNTISQIHSQCKPFFAGTGIKYSKPIHFGSINELLNIQAAAAESFVLDTRKLSAMASHKLLETSKAIHKPGENLVVGKRIGNVQVVAHADGRPWWIHQLLRSTGQWRLIVFAGNAESGSQMARLDSLGDYLTCSGDFFDSIREWVEVLTVHSSDRRKVEQDMFHEAFFPSINGEGYDYHKIFADTMVPGQACGQVYKSFDVDREHGCVALIRPDQHVEYIGSVDDNWQLDTVLQKVFAV